MLPVAYGEVNGDGTVSAGSGNFTVSHTPGTSQYLITLTSANLVTLDMNSTVALASKSQAQGSNCTIVTRHGLSVNNNIGAFSVDFLPVNTGSPFPIEQRFSFLLFKP